MIAKVARAVSAISLGAAFILAASISARAEMVIEWNQTALRATEIAAVPVPVQTRAMAMVHAAIFDAVNAIERKYAIYAIDVGAKPGASPEAAAAAAAHAMLERLYPLQKAITDAVLAGSLARIPDGPAKVEGLRLGGDIAEKLFTLRKDDGSSTQATYSFGTGAGVYQPTPPMNANPVLPQWRNVKPFIMANAKQFSIAGPPAVTSAAFAKDFEEIKRLGSRNSTERTNEQTAIAIHWAGSEVPPLNAVARAASAAKGLSLVDNARFFALLNMTMADALIVGFEAKYEFNFWRPVTAIRNAGSAGRSWLGTAPGDTSTPGIPVGTLPWGRCRDSSPAGRFWRRQAVHELRIPSPRRRAAMGEFLGNRDGDRKRSGLGRYSLSHGSRARVADGASGCRVRTEDENAPNDELSGAGPRGFDYSHAGSCVDKKPPRKAGPHDLFPISQAAREQRPTAQLFARLKVWSPTAAMTQSASSRRRGYSVSC
jgi:hypothetical protein